MPDRAGVKGSASASKPHQNAPIVPQFPNNPEPQSGACVDGNGSVEAQMPNRNRAKRAQIFPTPRLPRDLPPFWELEQLLREGFDRDSALEELARRREDQATGRRLPPMVAQSQPASASIDIFTIAS